MIVSSASAPQVHQPQRKLFGNLVEDAESNALGLLADRQLNVIGSTPGKKYRERTGKFSTVRQLCQGCDGTGFRNTGDAQRWRAHAHFIISKTRSQRAASSGLCVTITEV